MHRSDLIAVGMVLALARAVGAPAGDPSKSPPPAAAPAAPAPAEPGKPVQLASSDLGGLNALLPVGKTARKVVVPSIDEDGVLTSVTRMAKITRVDEDHFMLENVVLTSFDAEKIDPATGKPEATVMRISKGVYISTEKQLVSDRPIRISKPRLELIGESGTYSAVEGHAVLKGHTELLLTDLQAPAPAPDAGEPAAPDAEPADGTEAPTPATSGPKAPPR